MSWAKYVHWARQERTARGLPRADGDVLQTMATLVNDVGETDTPVATIAAAVGYSRQHVHKILARLERRELIITRRRKMGSAVRRLNIDAPRQEQLKLTAEQPSEPPSDVASVRHRDVASRRVALSPLEATQPLGTKEEEGARAQAERPALDGLQVTLPDVLAVLGEAPGLHIEPMAVNAILSAFPQGTGHDHRRAAQVVASWAHEGGLDCVIANRLLHREFVRQGERAARGLRTRTPSSGAGTQKAAKPWAGALRRAMEAGQL